MRRYRRCGYNARVFFTGKVNIFSFIKNLCLFNICLLDQPFFVGKFFCQKRENWWPLNILRGESRAVFCLKGLWFSDIQRVWPWTFTDLEILFGFCSDLDWFYNKKNDWLTNFIFFKYLRNVDHWAATATTGRGRWFAIVNCARGGGATSRETSRARWSKRN